MRDHSRESDLYDIVVIGGGPGGYASALYAHNFGLKVALVEKATVGGVCLTRGCIPAKTWLHAADVFRTVKEAGHYGVDTSEPTVNWGRALERKHEVVNQLVTGLGGLLRNRKVDIFNGFGRLAGSKKVIVSGEHGDEELEANHVIIATGSEARSIPGYDIDGERVVTSDHALDWPQRPEKVAIIGAGAIGCEFASLLSDFGSEVWLFEMLDQVVPGSEPQAANALERALKTRGVNVRTGTSIGNPVPVHGRLQVPFGEESVEVDVVLVAVGRAPQTDGIGLDSVNVETDRGYIVVDPATQLTAEPGVYAVGDVVAGAPQLAHAGFAEGIAAVTHIATGTSAPVDYRAIPLVVYSHPELASVGLTEAQAKEAGYEIDKTRHPFAGVGRAIIIGENQGMVKIVSEKDGPILGATVVGPSAGEMIHELMYAVAWEALPAEAAAFIHAHPTLSEAVGETLLGAAGRSLH
ncbi:MAG: dihydrolipoyl dehydrogenase [Acidimicrobiia bacterium]|nr:dihydrolipoyl dehydrogenase [Acidimicrobiia bacterium]NNL46836.1 dihydrolipoyl dehydrogenase [Acidimicrobiia bacterium]